MKNLNKLILLVKDPATIRELIRFRFSEYLLESGWIESLRRKEPVDSNGQPVPWMTLPFIQFMESRLKSSMVVFEYGSGNSTLYFQQRVEKVVAVEHDKEWYEKVTRSMPTGAEIIFKALDESGSYERTPIDIQSDFHIIAIDGRRRSQCLHVCERALTTDGVIILDDSERAEYDKGVQFLKSSGWKSLDFWGIAPGMHNKKCTSVFYRENNCLGI